MSTDNMVNALESLDLENPQQAVEAIEAVTAQVDSLSSDVLADLFIIADQIEEKIDYSRSTNSILNALFEFKKIAAQTLEKDKQVQEFNGAGTLDQFKVFGAKSALKNSCIVIVYFRKQPVVITPKTAVSVLKTTLEDLDNRIKDIEYSLNKLKNEKNEINQCLQQYQN